LVGYPSTTQVLRPALGSRRLSAKMRAAGTEGPRCCESDLKMSIKELLESWREHAAAPRTAGTWAVRLPLDDAARLAALAEMFPGRSPEQLVTELLGKALKELVAAMPYVAGKRVISTDEQGDPVYEDVGPTPRFMALARRHYTALSSNPGEKTRRRPRTSAAGAPARKKTRRKSAR
jgi:hypothetical protein